MEVKVSHGLSVSEGLGRGAVDVVGGLNGGRGDGGSDLGGTHIAGGDLAHVQLRQSPSENERDRGNPKSPGKWSDDGFPPEQKKRNEVPTPRRLENLYQHGKETARRRRSNIGRTPEEEGCTFHPVTNPNKALTGDDRLGTSRFDQLYERGKRSKAKLEETRKQLEQTESPSFKPKINKQRGEASSSKGAGRFSLLYEKARDQQRRQAEKQEKGLPDKECTFEPKILKRSIQQKGGKERIDSLYNHAKRLEDKRKEESRRLEKEHGFKPKINRRKSDKGTRRKDISSLCPDKEEIRKRQERLEMMKQSREMKGCTFSPRIDMKKKPNEQDDDVDVHTRLFVQGKKKTPDTETSIEEPEKPAQKANNSKVFNRLYENGKEWANKKADEEKLAQKRREEMEWSEIQKECTFSPTIPASSKKIAEKRKQKRCSSGGGVADDLFERLFHEGTEKQIKREMESTDRLGLDYACTFQPQINPTSKKMAEDRIQQELRQAERRLREVAIREQNQGASFVPNREYLPNENELECLGLSPSRITPSQPVCASPPNPPTENGNDHLLANMINEDHNNIAETTFRESSW